MGAEHMSAIVALLALTFVSVFLAIPPQKPSLHVAHIVFIAVESSHNYHGRRKSVVTSTRFEPMSA